MKRALIFIHINKTAGSSIGKGLGLQFEHKTAVEKIREIGLEAWTRHYRFSVVRNPWDRAVSLFHYRKQTNQNDLGLLDLTFGDWIQETFLERNPRFYDKPKMFMPQYCWLYDDTGRLLVDRVCRYETLERDLAQVCACAGLECPVLPHIKKSAHDDYASYYDQRSHLIIAKWFAADIVQFGYRFK